MPGQPDSSSSASSSSSRKPVLLICYTCLDPRVYAQLQQHFTVHMLALPIQLHPAIAHKDPALPVSEGESQGDQPERRWEEWACATTPQLVDFLRRHPIDALMGIGPTAITAEVFEAAAPRLKHVATVSVGYNHIDMKAAATHDVTVSNVQGTLDETTADLAVALMLCTARRLIEAAQTVTDGSWSVWRNQFMLGKDVSGSTVGIVGLGNIGLRVAHRLRHGFGCKILYSGRREKPAEAATVDATFVSFEELLAQSDFVVPQCPLTPATRHLFSTAQFRAMKPDAIFINTTRGQVVDQDALVAALTEGRIAGAGLDVTEPEPLPNTHPLVGLKNCVIFPHIGSATEATRLRMLQRAADNLVHWSKGEMDKVLLVDTKKT